MSLRPRCRRRLIAALIYGTSGLAGLVLLGIFVRLALPWTAALLLPLVVAWAGAALATPARRPPT